MAADSSEQSESNLPQTGETTNRGLLILGGAMALIAARFAGRLIWKKK
nr:LPXTG cell wall anchor domain-containing protein [uncultured Ligilactobacillus sp.]